MGEYVSLGICVSLVGEHISLGIRVSKVGEHISLGICVSQEGEHEGYVLTRWRGAHISRDMCFPGGGTHIIRNKCLGISVSQVFH